MEHECAFQEIDNTISQTVDRRCCATFCALVLLSPFCHIVAYTGAKLRLNCADSCIQVGSHDAVWYILFPSVLPPLSLPPSLFLGNSDHVPGSLAVFGSCSIGPCKKDTSMIKRTHSSIWTWCTLIFSTFGWRMRFWSKLQISSIVQLQVMWISCRRRLGTNIWVILCYLGKFQLSKIKK